MPENFAAAMATIGAVIMGANYTSILKMFGCCGVPILTGPPGSCKSEASKCALSTFGAHESHTCNNQTTPSYLFKAASETTVPICVDDVNEKAADAWEKLFIDAYNGSGRGTRIHGVEAFLTQLCRPIGVLELIGKEHTLAQSIFHFTTMMMSLVPICFSQKWFKHESMPLDQLES